MNDSECSVDPIEGNSSLAARIEPILLYVNLVLTILASTLIFRQRKVLLDLFADFDLEIPSLTLAALSPAVLVLLPGLLILALISHLLAMCPKRKLAIQVVDFVAILAVTGFFLVATLPVTMELIEQLG